MNVPGQRDPLLEVMVFIQTHLEEALPLERLAALTDWSPHHFHRRFTTEVGETPKRYTLRLRLEGAAYQLRVRDATILDIAQSVGFERHETFSRAFRTHFGVSPRAFRTSRRSGGVPGFSGGPFGERYAGAYQLSRLTLQTLQPLEVAFMRQTGPYAEADGAVFGRLLSWASERGVHTPAARIVGVVHDDPTVTPPQHQRFDACLELFAPCDPEGEIGVQRIEGRRYAAASYIGPFGAPFEEAYDRCFRGAQALPGVTMAGLPAVEVYRTVGVGRGRSVTQTDIYLPVESAPA
jgi:AraC family transcriptional regulator